MSAKILKISVLGVLVIVGLGAGFAVSVFTKGSDQNAPGQTKDAVAQGTITKLPPAASDLVNIEPNQSLLNELVRELRYKIGQYKTRQLELDKREKQIATALAVFTDEKTKLEELRTALDMPLLQLNDAIRELRDTRVLIRTQEKSRIQKTAVIYDKMDAASSSQILIEMCTNNEDDAVKILYYMSVRSAAKCLAEISTAKTSLAAKLTRKIKVINEES